MKKEDQNKLMEDMKNLTSVCNAANKKGLLDLKQSAITLKSLGDVTKFIKDHELEKEKVDA